ESEPGRAQAEGVGGEVHPSRRNAGVELCRPVAPIAEPGEDRLQISQEIDVDGSVAGDRLRQRQVGSEVAEVTCLQALQPAPPPIVEISTALEAVYGVDDQEGISEGAAWRFKVGRHSARRLGQDGGQRVV